MSWRGSRHLGKVRLLAFISGVLGLVAAGPTESAGLTLHHIHGLAVDPGDPAVLYIATHAGLVKGIRGRDWQFVGDDRSDFMGFTVHPTAPGLMVASGHPAPGIPAPNPRGVIVSRDGGRAWRPLALEGVADFHALTLSPADGDTLYGWSVGRSPGLYRVSLRHGTWTRLEARGLEEVFSLQAHPQEAETVLAGTTSGLQVSRDGGRTWGALGNALKGVAITSVAFQPDNPRILLAYAARQHLGLIESRDGGLTWSPLGLFLGDEDAVSHIALPRESATTYLATFRSDLYRSSGGTGQWQRLFQRGRLVQGR